MSNKRSKIGGYITVLAVICFIAITYPRAIHSARATHTSSISLSK